MEARFPIPLARFDDEEEWGDERTFRRLRSTLNQAWEDFRGIPLFCLVDANGIEKARGEDRYIKLNDTYIQTSRPERMAVMPALLQLLGIIKGTVISQSYTHMYKDFRADLDAKQRKYFDRTEKKFFYYGKGIKLYEDKGEVLDEVYDALLKEQKLKITRIHKGQEVEENVLPLTMILFNNGLYLACMFESQPDVSKLYKFKIESFLKAESMRGENFTYPTNYDPQNLFEGGFGFLGNSDPHLVKIEFEQKSWVEMYLKERRWTGEETYADLPNGKSQMSMNVGNLGEVSSWLLGMGADVKAIAPPKLCEIMREKLAKAANLYQ
jgi:predicted DNA-binding transcriptional regulator YafY